MHNLRGHPTLIFFFFFWPFNTTFYKCNPKKEKKLNSNFFFFFFRNSDFFFYGQKFGIPNKFGKLASLHMFLHTQTHESILHNRSWEGITVPSEILTEI